MRSAFRGALAGACTAAVLLAHDPVPTAAQPVPDAAGAPPAVLKLYRVVPKLGHERLTEQAGAGFGTVSDRFGAADHWFGATSMSGRGEVVWLEGFASHAAMEAQMAAMLGTPGLAAASDSVWRSVASHADLGEVLWAFHRPDLGYRAAWITPASRSLQIITFRVKPGMEADYEAVVKAFATAYAQAGVDVGWSVYQVSNGMAGPAYLMFIPMTSLQAIDRDLAAMGSVMSKVPDPAALMAQWARSGNSVGANVYALVPSLSRLPANFTRAGGGYWAR